MNKISFYYYRIKSLNHTSFVSNKKLANFASIYKLTTKVFKLNFLENEASNLFIYFFHKKSCCTRLHTLFDRAVYTKVIFTLYFQIFKLLLNSFKSKTKPPAQFRYSRPHFCTINFEFSSIEDSSIILGDDSHSLDHDTLYIAYKMSPLLIDNVLTIINMEKQKRYLVQTWMILPCEQKSINFSDELFR